MHSTDIFVKVAEKENITINKLEGLLGASKGVLSRAVNNKTDVQAKWLLKLVENYPKYFGGLIKGEDIVGDNFNNRVPMVITTDAQNRDNVVLVPVKAQAGYLTGFDNAKFIKTLPSYRLPNIDNGVFRMFQVAGDSMYPTLTKNSYVVGQFVEDWISGIRDNRVYVVVSQEDGVIVKRVINRISKYNNLMCKSDNRRGFPTINLLPSAISEVWEVKLHLNFDLPDPSDVYDRVTDLEVEFEMLKSKLIA
jgi:phage repressor protein C with HTH and peptisase S24 domain